MSKKPSSPVVVKGFGAIDFSSLDPPEETYRVPASAMPEVVRARLRELWQSKFDVPTSPLAKERALHDILAILDLFIELQKWPTGEGPPQL